MKVNTKPTRLFYIDAIRAWAIVMMLQGHFIDGLLDPTFRNNANWVYATWSYFRGITAPVFFTVSGFIFTYLLVRAPQEGWQNVRVKKGIRRGLELIFIGYLLRINILGLFKGEIYNTFYIVDVLHCIGFSLLSIVGCYLWTSRLSRFLFPLVMSGISLSLFLFEPLYADSTFGFLPLWLANYFTKANGSVFSLIPWVGYATAGSALAYVFHHLKDLVNFYRFVIPAFILVGAFLIFGSSPLFLHIYEITGLQLFNAIQKNNYLFIRLGDVFLVFAVFMLFRNYFKNETILKIGSITLTIYIVHFIILYGSFTGLGLYRFFHYELTPITAIFGAIVFVFLCVLLSLRYSQYKDTLSIVLRKALFGGATFLNEIYQSTRPLLKWLQFRLKVLIFRAFKVRRG